MLSVFNIIRLSVFAAVIAWSLIVLGLAAFFDHLFIANDLTRFIPLAIFVAVCTLLIIPTFLLFGAFQRTLIISQVRTELVFTGLLGLLWFILGIYTASEEEADVECDFDGTGDFVETDEYSSETYQAQYRVLKVFSVFNALLLVGFFLFLLVLVLYHHRRQSTSKSQYNTHLQESIWTSPITSYPFLSSAPPPPPKQKSTQYASTRQTTQLPAPVTAKVGVFAQVFNPKTAKTTGGAVDTAQMDGATQAGKMKAGGHYIIYIPPPPPPRN